MRPHLRQESNGAGSLSKLYMPLLCLLCQPFSVDGLRLIRSNYMYMHLYIRRSSFRSLSPGKFKAALRGQLRPQSRPQDSDTNRKHEVHNGHIKIPQTSNSNLTAWDNNGNTQNANLVRNAEIPSQTNPRRQSKPKALRQRHRSQEDMLSAPKVKVEPLDLSQL